MAAIDYRIAQIDQFHVFHAAAGFTPLAAVPMMVPQLRSKYPSGVDAVLIGLAFNPGYKLAPQAGGIIALLIGLLVPAVQRLAEPNSSDLLALKPQLKPRGNIGIAMGDGSVRNLAGPPMNMSAWR